MPANLEMKFYSNRSPKRGYSWETPPDAVSETDIKQTIEADVVIIGGGISGLAAAARCSEKGLKCIVLDKNKHMAALAGQIAAINTKAMADKGIYIDKKQFAADWLKISGSRVEEALLWIFINRSAEGFEWLLQLAGDCLNVGVYIGYRGPMFNEYLGTHHIGLKKDSTKYEHSGGGMLACEILEKAFLGNGGYLYRSTAAEYLEKTADGRVTSCIAKCEDGYYRRYIGSKAVVLATGDCSDDREMLEAFCPIGLRTKKVWKRPGNTGDGQKMAYWAGAVLDNPEWAPTLHGGTQFFYLHVNQLGKRFMNEDTWLQAKSIRCLMQPGGDYAFTVFDSKYPDEIGERWDKIGGQGMAPLSVVGDKFNRESLIQSVERIIEGRTFYEGEPENDGTPNGLKAETLEELAGKMNIPAEAFLSTVRRYNEVVSQGDDTDFGKRSDLLTPIVKPPFYALKWGPSLLDVFGGALTDDSLNVISADAKPIPGLYAVGNAAGGMYAVDYPLLLNGNSYGRALAYAMQLADKLIED